MGDEGKEKSWVARASFPLGPAITARSSGRTSFGFFALGSAYTLQLSVMAGSEEVAAAPVNKRPHSAVEGDGNGEYHSLSPLSSQAPQLSASTNHDSNQMTIPPPTMTLVQRCLRRPRQRRSGESCLLRRSTSMHYPPRRAIPSRSCIRTNCLS